MCTADREQHTPMYTRQCRRQLHFRSVWSFAALVMCSVQEKPQWWKKRKASVVKAHMLILAHLGRADIPDSLVADHKYVVTKSALLLEEMIKIASLPRPPHSLGWLAPIIGSVEMLQCLTQAVSVQSRKALGSSSKVGVTLDKLAFIVLL